MIFSLRNYSSIFYHLTYTGATELIYVLPQTTCDINLEKFSSYVKSKLSMKHFYVTVNLVYLFQIIQKGDNE